MKGTNAKKLILLLIKKFIEKTAFLGHIIVDKIFCKLFIEVLIPKKVIKKYIDKTISTLELPPPFVMNLYMYRGILKDIITNECK